MSIETKILLGAVLAIILAFAWLLIANADLRADLATERAGNTALHLANGEFRDAADKQAAALRAWQAETAKRAAAAQKAAAASIKHYKKEADLLARQKPHGDDCAAANALINFYLRQKQ